MSKKVAHKRRGEVPAEIIITVVKTAVTITKDGSRA